MPTKHELDWNIIGLISGMERALPGWYRPPFPFTILAATLPLKFEAKNSNGSELVNTLIIFRRNASDVLTVTECM